MYVIDFKKYGNMLVFMSILSLEILMFPFFIEFICSVSDQGLDDIF